MSAPKPRVTRRGLAPTSGYAALADWMSGRPVRMRPWYGWDCPCGESYRGPIRLSWQSVVDSAVKHSRTHAAERVADKLERRAAIAHADAVRKFERGWKWQGVEAMGNSEGIESAAILVRKHLVGGAS